MRKLTLLVVIAIMALGLVPLLGHAHCTITEIGQTIPDPVHCGGSLGPPPTGFIGVSLPDGSCLYLTDGATPPVVLDPAGCPAH